VPYRLIYNPVAGGGRAARVLDSLMPELTARQDLEVTPTRDRGHATQLARQVRDRDDMVVISLGGDGTHHEVLNGLMPNPRARLSVISAGSGNDFAGGMGLPSDPTQALAVSFTGKPRAVDVGMAGTEYFLTVVGAGFDAEVAGLINSTPHGSGSGKLLYLRGILTTLMRYRAAPLTLEVEGQDGGPRERPTLLLAAGNTARYAGGIRICPGAEATDGLLNVVWIGGVSKLGTLQLLSQAYSGRHVQHPVVETFQAAAFRLSGPPELFVHADGELVGHLPVDVRVLPGALSLLMPSA
jgi:diacylglycerol kinase (ATP)